MKWISLFLADVDVDVILQQPTTNAGLFHTTRGPIIFFTVLVVVVLALFLFVYLLYRKRRAGIARTPYPPSLYKAKSGKQIALAHASQRRRKRRRREHRLRNPTLAETGGLPPIRPLDPPPPPP